MPHSRPSKCCAVGRWLILSVMNRRDCYIRQKSPSDAGVNRTIEKMADNSSAQLTAYFDLRILYDAIDSHSYIAGYINGNVVVFFRYFIKEDGLLQESQNKGSSQVLLNLFGTENRRIVSSTISRHRLESTSQSQSRRHRSALVLAYAVDV